jgi:hypothetical protein
MLNGPDIDGKPRANAYNPFTDLPEVAVNRQSHNAPEVVLTDYPEVVIPKPYLEADKQYTTTGQQLPPPPTLDTKDGQKRQKILGLPRRSFFIACVVVVILCVCAIAIPVAITTTRQSSASQTGPNPTPPTPPRPPGPSISLEPSAIQLAERPTIAATNYTAAGVTRNYVFSQAANNSLLVSVWDSRNTTWKTLHLSAILDASDGKLALSFIPNTPIAAYAYMNPTFQMRLYALVAGNSIRELVCTDPTLQTSWLPGRLGFDTFLLTAEGSKLAALRPQCGTGEDCRLRFPHMAVAYESAAGQLVVAKSPQFRAQSMPNVPAPRTEIGLAAVMKKDNVSDLRWHLMYRAREGRLADWTSEGSLEDWKACEYCALFCCGLDECFPGLDTDKRFVATGDIAVAQVPSTSMTTFTFDLVNVMALAVPPKSSSDAGSGRKAAVSVANRVEKNYPQTGTLVVEETVPEGAIPEDAQFDSLSGSAERRVYGAIGGRIHEWQFDYSKESTVAWSYIGPVT